MSSIQSPLWPHHRATAWAGRKATASASCSEKKTCSPWTRTRSCSTNSPRLSRRWRHTAPISTSEWDELCCVQELPSVCVRRGCTAEETIWFCVCVMCVCVCVCVHERLFFCLGSVAWFIVKSRKGCRQEVGNATLVQPSSLPLTGSTTSAQRRVCGRPRCPLHVAFRNTTAPLFSNVRKL